MNINVNTSASFPHQKEQQLYRPYSSVSSGAFKNDYDNDDILVYQSGLDENVTFYSLIKFLSLKFVVVALSNPFEVAQTLLQTQHLPKIDLIENKDDVDEVDELSSSASSSSEQILPQPSLQTDIQGYVVEDRKSGIGRPSYQMKEQLEGAFDCLINLIKHEGISSIFKGLLTSFIIDLIKKPMQHNMEELMMDKLDIYEPPISLSKTNNKNTLRLATIFVISHTVSNIVLNPLVVLKHRLMVQTKAKKYKKYNGLISGLIKCINEENVLFAYSYNNIASIVIHSMFEGIFRFGIPIFMDRMLRIHKLENPIIYALIEYIIQLTELAVILPIDTIIKRLHIQPITNNSYDGLNILSFHTTLRTRKTKYLGVTNCFLDILLNENTVPTKKRGININGLYRGFSFHLISNTITALVSGLVANKLE